jgi:iron complex transport system ATP-binding protein
MGANVPVVELDGVSVLRRGRRLLDDVDLTVRRGDHWAVAGLNGAGKSLLLQVVAAQLRPSLGTATLLGERVGRVPVDRLRARIGLVAARTGRRFYPQQTNLAVALTGLAGTILLVDRPSDQVVERAREALSLVGVEALAERPFQQCSDGERARVLLARALLADSELLVLDEPTAGLDLVGRELFRAALGEAIERRPHLTTVTVMHAFDEFPTRTSDLLLLREGRVIEAGPIGETFRSEPVSACFGVALETAVVHGRLHATAASI